MLDYIYFWLAFAIVEVALIVLICAGGLFVVLLAGKITRKDWKPKL